MQLSNSSEQPAASVEPYVSVIIPVFNESATIREILDRLTAVPGVGEVVVVDDGSTDNLRGALAGVDLPIEIATHPANLGKGAAIRTGLQRASGDIVVIQDADMEYDPRQIAALVAPIIADVADVCYGTRFADGSRPAMSLQSWWANRCLTWLSNSFTGLNLTDMETCQKAFRRSAVDGMALRESRFGIEPELTLKLARRRLRFVEVPVTYTARSYAAGKKIGVKDGLRALWCILRYAWRD